MIAKLPVLELRTLKLSKTPEWRGIFILYGLETANASYPTQPAMACKPSGARKTFRSPASR